MVIREKASLLGLSLAPHAALAAASVFASSTLGANPVALDPATLDRVTASGDERGVPSRVGAGTRQDRAAELGSDTEANTDSVVTELQTGLVVDSQSIRKIENAVRLENDALADSRAMNEINAAGSDVAQGTNVVQRHAFSTAGNQHAEIEQTNDVSQSSLGQATLGRFVALGPTTTSSLRNGGSLVESAVRNVRLHDIDQRISLSSTTTTFSADVMPEQIGIFDDPVAIGGQTIDLPRFQVGFQPIDLKFKIADLPGDRFDVEVDRTITPPSFTIDTGSLTLGAITFDGNDIVLSSPQLTLPSLRFSFCFLGGNDCTSDDSDKKNFETLTIPGRTLSLGDIRLVDVNPLGDLGFSFGYAIAGDGTISFEAGGVDFAGSIPLDIGALLGLDFDLSVPGVGLFENLFGEIDLPSLDVPIDFTVDFPSPAAFNQVISTEACTLSQGGLDCAPLDETVQETNLVITDSGRTEQTEESRSETHYRVEVLRQRGEVELEEGKADLIVMRNSSANEKRYNVVIVADGAQSGARVLNAVNGAAAIVGSGLNVAGTQGATQRLNAGTQSGISQTNRFRQVGGL